VSWRLAGKVLADLQFMVNDASVDEAGRQNRKAPLALGPVSTGSGCDDTENTPQGTSPTGENPKARGAVPITATPAHGSGKLDPLFEGDEDEEETQVERAKVAFTELSQRGKSLPPTLTHNNTQGSTMEEESAEEGGHQKTVKQLPTRKNFANNLRNSTNPDSLHDSMQDGSDWHPRRSEAAEADLTAIPGQDRSTIVRSRIYSTSASTMHTLYNILMHGDSVCDTSVMDSSQKASLDFVSDLGYLSHFVIRCYEPPPSESGPPADDLSKYRVEICVSPGIFFPQPEESDERSPTPVDAFKIKGKNITKGNAALAPLYVMSANANLKELDSFITTIIKETTKEESERGDDIEEDEEEK
jgi:hypothetical protein